MLDKNKKIYLIYAGQSMNGTLKPGDKFYLENIFFKQLCKGDIIVIRNQNSKLFENQRVHRFVIKVNDTLFTRGDNNPQIDKEPVTEENFIGKVTHFERNGKIHKVWNGWLGMMRARVLHARLLIIGAAKFILRKPYRMLKKTGVVSKIWHPEIESIHFETQDGPLVKYVHKGKTVASCWTDTNRWWFKRPYDFVIDPKNKKK